METTKTTVNSDSNVLQPLKYKNISKIDKQSPLNEPLL